MNKLEDFKSVIKKIETMLNAQAQFRDMEDEKQASATIYWQNSISPHNVRIIESEVSTAATFTVQAQGNRIFLKFRIIS